MMERVQIGLEMRALNNLIRRYIDFSSHKREIETITGNNGWIIGYLGENADAGKTVYQKDIEEYFNVTRSTVSNVLNLMEHKDLIERQTVDRDARLKKIVLTEKAEKIKDLMKEDMERVERVLTGGFSETELQTLHGYIRRMKNNLSVPKPLKGGSRSPGTPCSGQTECKAKERDLL